MSWLRAVPGWSTWFAVKIVVLSVENEVYYFHHRDRCLEKPDQECFSHAWKEYRGLLVNLCRLHCYRSREPMLALLHENGFVLWGQIVLDWSKILSLYRWEKREFCFASWNLNRCFLVLSSSIFWTIKGVTSQILENLTIISFWGGCWEPQI